MGLQLQSADYLHDDGLTYCIRRESLDQDFTFTRNEMVHGSIVASIKL